MEILEHGRKVALSGVGFLLLFVVLHYLNRKQHFVVFDTLGFIGDTVVPKIENASSILLQPCPLVGEDNRLSKFSDLKFCLGFGMWALVWHSWLCAPFKDRKDAVASVWLKPLMAIGFNLTALSSLQCDNAKGFYWPLIMNCCNAWLVLVRFPGRTMPSASGEEERQYTHGTQHLRRPLPRHVSDAPHLRSPGCALLCGHLPELRQVPHEFNHTGLLVARVHLRADPCLLEPRR
mmetsp:Transcript_3472/g.8075  ORF Transcript_3472/g.8075 Transcript_3472/m.8075 type:complete len:234 (+) Transcript_3472:63-764(+)